MSEFVRNGCPNSVVIRSFVGRSCDWTRINEIIPWEVFRPRLKKVWREPGKERKSNAGRKLWDEIVMFKALILCALYKQQRNTRDENESIRKGGVPGEWKENPSRGAQKDTDARWTKKRGASYYGYKNHVNVDREHKFIRGYEVTVGL